MGSFGGLNVAISGLFASQKNLQVISHNLGNANTQGYSRQEAVQEARRPLQSFDGTGMFGLGSSITSVTRVRSEYLDARYWAQNQVVGESMSKEKGLMDIEAVFGEPSESGITTAINGFYDSLYEFQKDPGSASVRANVYQNAITLTEYFKNISGNLEKIQSGINKNVDSVVSEINSLGEQIVKLNQQIFTFELTGNIANDLRDKRGLLIDKLSNFVDVKVDDLKRGILPSGLDDKRLRITIGDQVFIDHDYRERMYIEPRAQLKNSVDTPNLYDVVWKNGRQVNVNGGQLKGYLDVRDGNGGIEGGVDYKGIPHYLDKLNQFARQFAKVFNEGFGEKRGHADGYGIHFDSEDLTNPLTGIRFFTMTDINGNPLDTKAFLNGSTAEEEIDNQYQQITAKNITVGKDILEGYFNIAASSVPNSKGNSDIISDILDLRHDKKLFKEGTPEDFFRSLISSMATDLQQSTRKYDNSTVILNLTENRRLSEAGVSVDEEMTDMLKQQQIYQASASLMNTWNEIYEALMNGL